MSVGGPSRQERVRRQAVFAGASVPTGPQKAVPVGPPTIPPIAPPGSFSTVNPIRVVPPKTSGASGRPATGPATASGTTTAMPTRSVMDRLLGRNKPPMDPLAQRPPGATKHRPDRSIMDRLRGRNKPEPILGDSGRGKMGIDPATKQTISGAALDTTAVGMEVSDVVSLAKDMSDALGIGLGVAGAVTSAASALYLTRQLISCNDRITSLNAAATTLSFSGDEELSGILKDAVKANELSKKEKWISISCDVGAIAGSAVSLGVGGADLGITAVSMAIATRVAKWGYRYANRHEIKTIRRNAENASDKLKIKIKDLRDKLSQTVTPPQVLQLSSSDFNLIKVCKELKIFDYHGDTGQFNLWIGDKGTRGQADTEVRTEFLGPLRDALSRIGDSDIDKKIVG